jgi:phospholipid transport system substrate-binding protein
LGKHWRNASDDERVEFIEAFYGSLLRKYGDGILEFDQSSLEILPFRGDDTKKRATVKTIVLLDDGTKVPVNYGVVKRDSGWMMFDVTIEGISYVRNFRTELNAEIQAKGLRAVIDRLNNSQTTAAVSE